MTQKKQLGDILVEAEIITVKTLERALERQRGSNKRLGTVLEEMGVITEEELAEALAKQYNFKTVTGLAGYSYPADLLATIPEDMALQKLIFPIKKQEDKLALAITDPFDADTLDYIAKLTGCKVFPVLTSRREIMAAISKHYLKDAPLPSDRRRVLVVEDSTPVATVIEVALTKEGFDVKVAHDGLQGLKLAMEEHPQLIICDSIMPRMDGYGLLRAIKANDSTREIPMILLTSKASGEDEQKALESGFLDFIPKPVMPIRVVSRVKRAFELMKSMQR